jgi:hypothetical protein
MDDVTTKKNNYCANPLLILSVMLQRSSSCAVRREVDLGEQLFGKRRKLKAVRRKQHLREVFKPAVRGLFSLPRDVILRVFSYLDPVDRCNLGVVHQMFRFVDVEVTRIREEVRAQTGDEVLRP